MALSIAEPEPVARTVVGEGGAPALCDAAQGFATAALAGE